MIHFRPGDVIQFRGKTNKNHSVVHKNFYIIDYCTTSYLKVKYLDGTKVYGATERKEQVGLHPGYCNHASGFCHQIR